MHEFMYDKSCLTGLIAFSDEMTGFVGNRTVEYLVYLDISKAFDTVEVYPNQHVMDQLDEQLATLKKLVGWSSSD